MANTSRNPALDAAEIARRSAVRVITTAQIATRARAAG